MAIRHTVKQGDSLWALANQYLGSGTKFPDIVQHHNTEAVRFKLDKKVFPIEDPNLIYVGQTIMIPPRGKDPNHGTGKKHQADKIAAGLQLKVEYETQGDTKTTHYKTVTPDYTIEAGMTAKIGIENLSEDRYRYNLELALSKDKHEIKQKLSDFNDKAFKDLTDGVKMIYESGQVTIKAPIATHANVGPYTFKVQADAPNHFSGSVKLEPLSGVVEKENRKFSYTAEVEFKVDVTWHPTPKGNPEPVKVKAADEGRARELNPPTKIDWHQVAENVSDFAVKISLVVIGTISLQARMAAMMSSTTSMPFMYNIDLNTPYNSARQPGWI